MDIDWVFGRISQRCIVLRIEKKWFCQWFYLVCPIFDCYSTLFWHYGVSAPMMSPEFSRACEFGIRDIIHGRTHVVYNTSEYMKVHIFELRRMKWKHDWSSQLYTQLKKLQPKKIFRPERDLNPWPLRYRCSALPTELSSQLGAGYLVSS